MDPLLTNALELLDSQFSMIANLESISLKTMKKALVEGINDGTIKIESIEDGISKYNPFLKPFAKEAVYKFLYEDQ